MYEHKILSTGREVEIRPLSWDEFWEFGRLRMEAASRTEEPLTILAFSRESRERTLSACVQDWEAIRREISLPEVLEIEKLIEELSQSPVLTGNSSPAADGQETAGV